MPDTNFDSIVFKVFILVFILSATWYLITTLPIGKYSHTNTKSGFTTNPDMNIEYVYWIGDVESTLNLLSVLENTNNPIQPIYVADASLGDARSQYEIDVMKTIRTHIFANGVHNNRILPIITVTDTINDAAFNEAYKHIDNPKNISSIRAQTAAKWATYMKKHIWLSAYTSATNKNTKTGNNGVTKSDNANNKTKIKSKILSYTWSCMFPNNTGDNLTCGKCIKCKELANHS